MHLVFVWENIIITALILALVAYVIWSIFRNKGKQK